ncbi:hypothetical protein GOODEAATRI_027772 [Goodea atripinnis]|uniref:Uncharacterized protein n=1 Tax=Goodea atripinnis TaxID=208336 RepID=A0ABV0NNR9_9TELE
MHLFVSSRHVEGEGGLVLRPRAELLICTSLSVELANAPRQLGALCAGKRRDHLASLTRFWENVTFHQTAIYRLLLRGKRRDGLNTNGRTECKKINQKQQIKTFLAACSALEEYSYPLCLSDCFTNKKKYCVH